MIVYNYQCRGYNMPQRDNTGQRGGLAGVNTSPDV